MAGPIDENTSRLMDTIRGVASLVVAAVHAFQVFVLPYFGLGTFSHLFTSLMATYAVLIFFVVSGFMISISVAGHSKSGRFNWRSFLVARIARIYPPLLAAIGVSVLVYMLVVGLGLHGSESFRLGGELFVARERVEMTLDTLIATILLSYGTFPYSPAPISLNGSLWTLGYEFWFYILCMLLINMRERRVASGFVPGLIFLGIVLFNNNLLQYMFLVVWAAGYGLGVAYQSKTLDLPKARSILCAIMVVAVVAIVVIGRDDVVAKLVEPYGGSRNQQILAAVGVIFTVLLGFAISYKLQFAASFFSRAADYSYSLYVLHWPLYIFAFSLLHPWLHAYGWGVSMLAACLVFSAVVAFSFGAAKKIEDRHISVRLLSRFKHASV